MIMIIILIFKKECRLGNILFCSIIIIWNELNRVLSSMVYRASPVNEYSTTGCPIGDGGIATTKRHNGPSMQIGPGIAVLPDTRVKRKGCKISMTAAANAA